ncbi:KrfA [Sphingopyxis sp. LC81]|jgi:hypothetical protein|uniref:DNA-binding protein n=1 Tax=Sphingopyxis sp. LC81 TaxID=1502850 RepID=UPI00050EE6EC|nr:DNA-binding protein [Sphingopyxis sp. LC81]KGB55020.1 KrfA [Sphingopyxis sp. LC81]
MALTPETVWRAADELDAEGARPTLSAVRKRLGLGSFTTIQEAMVQWKARREQAAAAPQEPPPPDLAERATALAGDIWGLARAAADATLASERQQMAAERETWRAELAEAIEGADVLAADNERLAGELADLRGQRDRMTAELALEKRRAGDSEERASAAAVSERAALDRAAHAEGQIAALEKQLARRKPAPKAPDGKTA